MRILHINCNYLGTTLHQLMIERLDDMGIDNHVFVPTYDHKLSIIEPNANVSVSECFNKWDRIVYDYKQRKILSAIDSKYDIASFNCIHAYTLFTDGNAASRLSEKYDVPYVVAVRNTEVNDFFAKMVHLRSRGIRTMMGAKKIFFLSEEYRKQVFERYVPKKYREYLMDKVQVVPNGIDDFWFNNEPNKINLNNKITDGKIRLIYAGRIDKNKNICTTQKAVLLLREQGVDATLTVVGKVTDQRVYDQIKKHPYTTVLPAMQKEQLIEQYRKHDIFIMPSFKESFGLVYAEAMSQGLPVIYTMGQGFDGQFPEGKVGFHVNPYDYREIVDKIRKISKNYSVMQSNAIQGASLFIWKEIVKHYYNSYFYDMEEKLNEGI